MRRLSLKAGQFCAPGDTVACNELPSNIPECIAGEICVTNVPLPPNLEPIPLPGPGLPPQFPTPLPEPGGVPGGAGSPGEPPPQRPAPRSPRGPTRPATPVAPPPPESLPEVTVIGQKPGEVPFGPIPLPAVGPVVTVTGALGQRITLSVEEWLAREQLRILGLDVRAPGGFPEPPAEPFVGPPEPGPVELPTAKPLPPIEIPPATEISPGQLQLFEQAAAETVATKPSLLSVLGGLIGKAFGGVGLLLQPTEAGFAPGVEEALVATRLTNPFGLPPITLPSVEGLPADALESVPELLPSVTVTAPRTAPAVPVSAPVGFTTPFDVGTGVFPTPADVPIPQPRPRPAPAPRASPRTGPAPLLGEFGGPGPSSFPGEAGKPGLNPTPAPQSQPLPDFLSPTGTCTCAPEKPKKKPKKRKKQRTVCYRGTYREHTSGLSKSRKERIPCR